MEVIDGTANNSINDGQVINQPMPAPFPFVKRVTMPRVPRMHLVITNISKRPNIRALLLNAAAFGCQSVLMVGQRNFDIDPQTSADMPGSLKDYVSIEASEESQQTPSTEDPSCTTETAENNSTLVITRFEKWNAVCDYMTKKRIRLVGVEIHKDAVTIEDFLLQCCVSHQFGTQDVAFIMGNEGQGLNEKHMASCETFIRLPQYGVGTASLNVYVAASLVLHRFHQWQLEQQQQLDHERL